MQISDINGIYDVKDIAELELRLAARIGGSHNAFWLYPDGEEFPKLSILVKDNIAALYYIPQEFEADYCSKGEMESLAPGGRTTFSISRNSGDDVEVANDVLQPFCDALSAAKEFYCSHALPGCIEWLEL